jgi:hypothetical protein
MSLTKEDLKALRRGVILINAGNAESKAFMEIINVTPKEVEGTLFNRNGEPLGERTLGREYLACSNWRLSSLKKAGT